MSNLAGKPSAGKVELLIDDMNVRRALRHLDFDALAETLGVSVNQIKNALLSTAMTRSIVDSFTPGILTFKRDEMKTMQQRGKTVLEPYKAHRDCVGDFVWLRHEYSRILIDTAIIPAVVEAQKHQNTSPITITSGMSSLQTEPDEHLVIVQDYQIPEAKGSMFRGPIDYVIQVR
ncbi:hypothetical protein B0H17DRAFT_1212673 [Mycena rosella]|uniref:Uncharacterized protein n=1 Tax=Mycena rosella TaxID=1033263 RepID=A0AAD7CRC5_MYCRO|nr:hypothetical protein B0H17DRAFT_1212673 [Mycena rosella]